MLSAAYLGVARLVVGPPADLLSHRLPGDAGWEPGPQLSCDQHTSTQPFPVAARPPPTRGNLADEAVMVKTKSRKKKKW